MRHFEYAAYRWERHTSTSVRDGRGPERVDTATSDPTFRRRPVGFTADVLPDAEPLTWDGDDS